MSTVPESLQSYRFDLVTAIDRELARGRSTRRAARRYLYAGVAVTAIALLALAFAEPWHGSPTILDRAEAAMLAPVGGEVLYESVTVHAVSGSRAPRGVTRVQLWLDSSPPNRFRMTFTGSAPAEVGGTIGSSKGLNYVAATNLLYPAAFQFRVAQSDLDPAAFIRTALRSGRAKLLGDAAIRGRKVIAIRLTTWFGTPMGRRLEPIALYYVDAHTYRPVRVVVPPPNGHVVLLGPGSPRDLAVGPEDLNGSRLGFPMDPSAFLVGFPGYPALTLPGLATRSAHVARTHLVYDFDAYSLLPATANNHRLASVQALRNDVAAYASGFRAASTPVFKGLDAYDSCLQRGKLQQLGPCARSVAAVQAALPRLLWYVTSAKHPATSLPSTNADLRRLATSLRSLRYGFAKLAALIASDDFVNPTRYTGAWTTFWKSIFELQADVPELRLRFS